MSDGATGEKIISPKANTPKPRVITTPASTWPNPDDTATSAQNAAHSHRGDGQHAACASGPRCA